MIYQSFISLMLKCFDLWTVRQVAWSFDWKRDATQSPNEPISCELTDEPRFSDERR